MSKPGNKPGNPTRRILMQGGTAGMVLVASQARAQRAAQPGMQPPNIVFILADDLGYADLPCYGRPDILTPNIDRLAREGVRLTQAYANSAVCSATRTALITGRYQYRLAVGLEEPIAGSSSNMGLPPGEPTLPALLRKAGYGTTLIGKWHLGSLPDYSPALSGYDHFWGFRTGALDYFTHLNVEHKEDLWDGDMPVHETGYMTDLIGNRAVAAVAEYAKAGQPFLLSVHFNAPHWPWEAPGDEAEAERLQTASLRHYDGGSQRTYKLMVERMDLQVGRVLDGLEAGGIAGNTIVVFTSDNDGERFADTWPFTGRKTELLEGGLRVPASLRWPARVAAGQVSDQVAISMDWMPTLLAAAGTTPAAGHPCDGIDMLPVLADGGAPVPRTLFWRYKANWQRAVRDGDWKLLKIAGNTFLFDVALDPMERSNLKDRHPDVYARLVAAWDAWNAAMLAEAGNSFTEGISASQLADHVGAVPAPRGPDPDPGWPVAKVP